MEMLNKAGRWAGSLMEGVLDDWPEGLNFCEVLEARVLILINI